MMNKQSKIAVVVATKDRPNDLEKLLHSISAQTVSVEKIVVVDSSKSSIAYTLSKFPNLNIKYIYNLPPSASKQRNIGVENIADNIDLIGFFDDDIVLNKDSIEQMVKFWSEAKDDVAGASFNIMNPDIPGGKLFKRAKITDRFGIYSRKYGGVALSGWQVAVETVPATCYVEWIPTTAAVWKKDIFRKYKIDEFYQGYSYLEDLDFSYKISKKYRIAVVAEAKYYHYHSPLSRISQYQFGMLETLNRRYFVQKNGLSLNRFYFVISLRILMNVFNYIKTCKNDNFMRVLGNMHGFKTTFSRKFV